VLLVALDPGAGVDEGDRARIFELSPESGVLAEGALDLRARAIVVSTSGTQAWLAWISDDDPPELRGAPLVETDAGWQIGEPASYSTAAPWPLRRAQGAVDLSVTLGSSAQGFGAVAVLRLEDRGWNALAVLGPTREGSTTGAAALGESGGRWGLLRSFLPDEQEAAEVRLDRFRTEVDAVPCSTPGECIRVTTDRTPSEPADVAALPGGWALAWTDEQDGQTDVFTTVATCRETAR